MEEEVQVFFSDTGLVATVRVSPEIAEKMRNDPVYASDVIAQLASSSVQPEDDLCASPLHKKVCAVRTPEVLKNARHKSVSSTPRSCSKALAFKSSFLKMSNLPDPFLESNFIRGLEKCRIKKGIAANTPKVIKGITNYDRSAGTAVIELVSEEVAVAFVNELGSFKSFRSQNTIVFQKMDDEINVSNIYDDDTIGDEETDFQPLIDDDDFQPLTDDDDFQPVIEDYGSSDEYQPDLLNSPIPSKTDGKCNELTMSKVGVAANANDDLSQPVVLNASIPSEAAGKSDEFGMSNIVAVDVNGNLSQPVLLNTSIPPEADGKCDEFVRIDDDVTSDVSDNLFQQDTIENSEEVKDTRIKVVGLPALFDEKAVKHLFNCKLWEGGIVPKFTDGIVSITSDDSFVTLKFVNSEASTFILKEDFVFKYRGNHLTVEPFLLKPSAHDLKIALTGIPPDYDEDMGSFLKFSLNEILWDSGILRKGEEGALHISQEGPNKLVLQFLNCECVKHLLFLETIAFLDSTLKVHPYFPTLNEMSIQLDEDLTNDELSDHESRKLSVYVQVSNISASYNKEDFLQCIQSAMETANFCEKNDKCILQVLPFDPVKRAVIVQFSSSEEANLATLLENVVYKSKMLIFEKTCFTDSNITITATETGNDLKTSTLEASNDDFYVDEEEEVSLSSEEGLNIFLKVLCRFRDEIPKGGSHDPFLEGLVPIMAAMGVSTNVIDMRNRKALFRERFRKWRQKGKYDHFLYNVACVIFEGANKRVLKGSFFEWKETDEAKVANTAGAEVDADTKFMDDLTKYSEAASWNNKSELALVQCFLENKEMFDDPKRKPHFWRHISAEMWQSCQAKYNQLSAQYRNLCDEENATGGAGPLERIPDDATRQVMEVMHAIKQYDVDANPRMTMSAGVQMNKTVRSDLPQGRTRHPKAKKGDTERSKPKDTLSEPLMLFAKAYALKQKAYALKQGLDPDDLEEL
ncbi:Filamin-C [Frankliniella fusca]|uniref:Filamin-C n=1 Tax=Frankliniella fusca TaxID=407009 RepID=A0AAE1H8K2_9NEOP|nr:Filamin-C [Frankliniella fusca]